MKKLISLLLLILVFSLTLGLCSCDLIFGEKPEEEVEEPGDGEEEGDEEEEKIPTISLIGITLPSKELVYDGESHSTEIVGEITNADVTVKYEGNGVTDAGTHTVVAKFYYKDTYLEGKDLTATIKIARATVDVYGIYFNGKTVIYDGKEHSLTLGGELPAPITVEYEGGGKSAVGEYTVTAKLKVDEKNYEPIPDMEATLRIIDGPSAFAGAYLEDLGATYDGKAHMLAVGGVGSDVEVSYSDTAKTNAGEYKIVATLTKGGESAALTSTLTVYPRRLSVSAADATYTYTGSKRSIQLVFGEGDDLDGIIVEEIGNGTAAIGVHTVIFRFSLAENMRGNILYQPDIKATLTINPNPNSKSSGLEFEANSAGNYVVTGYTGAATGVIIPEKYTNSLGIEGRVVGIAPGAFEGNTRIEYVYIHAGVRTIGNKAFSGCTSLKSVTISSGVTAIGALAFEDCPISDIEIPDSVTAIGQGAFRGTSPSRIKLPFIGGSKTTSNPYIGYIFGASAYGGNEQFLPESLKTVVLSDSCTLIPAYSFFGASGIDEVIIGTGVKEIGISAFSGCTSLKGLFIPSTVTYIPAAANNYNSPIYNCADGFVIATDAASALTGWAIRYDILNESARAEKLFATDYEGFLKAIREELFLKK